MYGYLFTLPGVVGLLLFFMYPFISSFQMSFSKVDSFTQNIKTFVGLNNYKDAFFSDIYFSPKLLEVIGNTLINLPLIIIFSLFVAYLLNKKIVGLGIFRTLFFLPVMLGSGFIMQQLMQQDIQSKSMLIVINFLLPDDVSKAIGATGVTVILDFLARLSTIFWKSGVQIIIFLSGLQGINKSLYEAASVDSASGWEKFWLITLPLIVPTMFLNVIYTIIDFCADANNSVVSYIMGIGFGKYSNQFELAAAMGFIFFLFVIFLIGLIFIVFKPMINNIKER
jgi:ABC-type sugar transport system permease subunit